MHQLGSLPGFQNARNKGLTIECLPLEILLSICHHIPTSSAAALTLASQAMLSKLGRRYIADLRGEYADKFETRRFLRLLSRDLPHLRACDSCLCFHRHHYALSWGTRPLKECVMEGEKSKECEEYLTDDPGGEQQLFSGRKDITWELLNGLMQLHAAGHDLKQHLEELGTGQFDSDFAPIPEVMEFRINYESQLLMREARSHHNGETLNLFVCPHVRICTYPNSARSKLPSILRCAYSHQTEVDQHHCKNCGELRRCDICPTEFLVMRADEESTEHVRGLPMVILTRWLNLGDMYDPFDPFWRSHLKYSSSTYPRLIGEAQFSVDREPGSIAAAWEQSRS